MSHLRARQPKLSWWLGFLKRVSGVQAAQQDNLVGFPEQPKSATFARLTTGIIFAGKEKSSEEIGIAALCWDNVLSLEICGKFHIASQQPGLDSQ